MGYDRVTRAGPGRASPGACLFFLLAAAQAAFAATADPAGPLSSSGPSQPSFEVLPPGVWRPDLTRPEFQRILSSRHPGYLRFLADHPGSFRVEWNEATGTPHRIFGDALKLALPGGPPLGGRGLEEAVRVLLGRYPELFPVRGGAIELEAEKDLGGFRLLRFRQVRAGVPVLGSRVEAWVAPGDRVVLLGCDVVPEALFPSPAPAPRIRAEEAVARSAAHAGPEGLGPGAPEARLAYVPAYQGRRLRPRLAWEVRASGGDSGHLWVYLIAAQDDIAGPGGGESASAGGVIGRWDQVSFGSVSGTVRGQSTPGLDPDTDWNPPQFAPLSGLSVQAGGRSAVSGPDGAFDLSFTGNGPVTVTAALKGPFARVQSLFGGLDLAFSAVVPSGSQVAIDFNPAPTEFSTAQVNAFREVNRAHDLVKELDPSFGGVDRPILVQVNYNQTCNANFTPQGEDGVLTFFRKGVCVNSAYSTVIYHEYSHFVVWKVFGGRPWMPAYNEGISDSFSALLSDQPVIGSSFNGVQGAGGGAIRDLSGPPLSYPGDVLVGPHTSGLIVGGTLWDLRLALGAAMGPQEGLDLARHLWLKSLFLAPPMISPDLTVDFLSLDDDDGILANGTPHFEEIAGAFALHGLPPPGDLAIVHEPLPDSPSLGPFAVEASVRSDFAFVVPASVTLHWSIDGGYRYDSLEMVPAGGTVFRSEIPVQVRGTTVRYFIEAAGSFGARALFPEGAPSEETEAFAVGEVERVFDDDFNGAETGWTHDRTPNGNPENEDDWQRGAPHAGVPDPNEDVDGNLLDPPSAFSPPNCWGNDIGKGGLTNRNHARSSQNYLESPPIDCSGRHGVHLRFRRWLTLERYDRARVLVNGATVWQSPSGRDTLDVAWRALDYDISGLADDRAGVRIRFELYSNSVNEAGGWNVDDVAVVATGLPPISRPTLVSVSPAFDFRTGGARFTLRGTGFTSVPDTRLFFGQSLVTDFAVADPLTIAGVAPPSPPGTQAISIENGGGATALPGSFIYYDLPSLDEVIPPQGGLSGGISVTFLGDFFTTGTEVLVRGNPIQDLYRIDRNTVMGTLPPGGDIGPAEVLIRSRFGESRFPAAFIYVEPPVLDAVEPRFGLLQGGIGFTLKGNWFPDQVEEVAIDFGSRRATDFTVRSRGEIAGVVPPADAPGLVDVRIATPGGTAVLTGAFRFYERAPAVFIRGDANLDREVQISDAIAILWYLFLGYDLTCPDAADSNDDSDVNISDPIAVLSFLFTGGAPPPYPYPDPGPDLTDDPVGCVAGLR